MSSEVFLKNDKYAGYLRFEIRMDEEEENLLSCIKISNLTFEFELTDICYDSFLVKLLNGTYKFGGNSYSYISKKNDIYTIGNYVSGSGGDSEFRLQLEEETIRDLVSHIKDKIKT